jgi:hypothetical protein
MDGNAPAGRGPLAAPASWLPLLEPAPGGAPRNDFPAEGWPSIEKIDYLSKLITLMLLLLALPWLIEKLFTHPAEAWHATAMPSGA